jgi:hypothetical protein
MASTLQQQYWIGQYPREKVSQRRSENAAAQDFQRSQAYLTQLLTNLPAISSSELPHWWPKFPTSCGWGLGSRNFSALFPTPVE